MNTKDNPYPIASSLMRLTEHEIALLDQEATNGESWEYYCNGYVTKAAVFLNRISGTVREYLEDFWVDIQINGPEISTRCSCSRNGGICKHIVALLYSWVNDQEAFVNVGNTLKLLQTMKKEELIELIGKILLKDPRNLDVFNDNKTFEERLESEGLIT